MKLIHWDEVKSTAETNNFCVDLALRFADTMSDTSFRAALADSLLALSWAELRIQRLGGDRPKNTKAPLLPDPDIESALEDRRDCLQRLCKFEIPYSSLSAGDAASASQILALFQKRADIDLGVDKEAVAYGKFVASERRCEETNRIFKAWGFGMFQFHPDVERVLYTAQRKIASLLGNVPKIESLRCRFGPGATTQVQKRTASPRYKLGEVLACSEDLVPLLEELLQEVPGWVGFTADSDSVSVPVQLHDGVLSFVPKNAKTDRSIVVEPSLNSFLQLGVGDYIAERLRSRGVDIRDQSVNQKRAQLGSLTGELATLDLSSASDLIARELVAHLLPIDWFLFLDCCRTSSVTYQGKTMKLQKFSSMGNGFTFPLETLIFWAISSSCIDESKGELATVYGDDIIVPVTAVPLVRASLEACGFILNMEKSFWTGPFRESCGKDYHSGLLIRPAFIKDRISGEAIFILHNFFVRNGDFETALYLRTYLDKSLQLYGPDGYGDGHLLRVPGESSSDDSRAHKRELGWAGYTFDTFTWKGRKSYRPSPGDYVYSSYVIYMREEREILPNATLVKQLARMGSGRFRSIFGDDLFNRVCSSLQGLPADAVPVDWEKETFAVTLPGTKGYKRISIYTLSV